MPNVDLNIVLKLLDEASGQIKKTLGETKDESKNLGNESVSQNKKMQNEFKESTKQIKQFRSNVMLAVAVVAGFINATREYARYNKGARESLDDVELSFHKLAYSAGEVIEKLGILKLLQKSMEGWSMIGSMISQTSLTPNIDNTPVDQMVQAEQSIRNLKQEQSDLNTLYMVGTTSAIDYYSAILSSEYNVQMVRQTSMQQMQEMATLEMQVGNDSFMHAQRLTQERINLLNYYQQNYNTAHQGMAAFTVMLGNTIQTNLSAAIQDVIMNVHNSKDAFKQLEKAMIQAILNFMIQKMVAWTLEKTLLAATVTSTSAAAAAIAVAWAPAAVAASIATLGGAAATGTAAYVASLATAIASTTGANAATKSVSVEGTMSGGGEILDISGGFGTYGGAQAEGGDYMVNRPTWFLAGEAGPERATFTPMGKSSSGQQGGNVYIDINIDKPVVSKESDIDSLVEAVSRRLSLEVERIR